MDDDIKYLITIAICATAIAVTHIAIAVAAIILE